MAGRVALPAVPCQFFERAYRCLSRKARSLTRMCIDGVGWVARCANSSSCILASRLPPAAAMLPRVVDQQMFIAGQSTQGSRLGHTTLLLSIQIHYSSSLGSRCIGYESTYWEALRVWVLCFIRVGVVFVIDRKDLVSNTCYSLNK